MKFSLLFLSFLIPYALQAESLKSLSSINVCEKEFFEFAKTEKFFDQEFKNVLADRWNQKFFRNMPNQMGEGIELQFEEKKAPTVLRIQNQFIQKFSFNKDCKVEKSFATLPWNLEKAFGEGTKLVRFDDHALKKIVESKKPSIIYSWSPRYAYSVYDLPRVKKIAESLGYSFIAVADPRVSDSEIKSSLEKMLKDRPTDDKLSRQLASENQLMVNQSYELYFRGGFNHFPFTYVVGSGKIHPRFIVGVMKDEGYKDMMATFMKELN